MRLFDLHCDTLVRCAENDRSLFSNEYHVDIKRGLRLFEEWIQVMAVFIPDGVPEEAAYMKAIGVLDYFERQLSNIPLAHSRCKLLLSIENGVVIGNDLERIGEFADRGIVSMNITWNGSNRLGNGCFSSNTDGLTLFGKKAVHRLFEVGILPDVSHLNEHGFFDVLTIANEHKRPFIASHSLSKTVYEHNRSLSDDQFRAVCSVNGLVGLNLCKDQLCESGDLFDSFRNHLEHFLALGGERVLALGMDLDGMELDGKYNGIDVAVALYNFLLRKNFKESLLDQLFFKNSYDFFEKTLTIAT